MKLFESLLDSEDFFNIYISILFFIFIGKNANLNKLQTPVQLNVENIPILFLNTHFIDFVFSLFEYSEISVKKYLEYIFFSKMN